MNESKWLEHSLRRAANVGNRSCLMAKPKLLLLDEPSMGLAPLLVKQIFNIIEKINEEGTTILLVEQNANMALSIAHHAYVIETGKVVISGDAKELQSSDQIREAYLGGV